MTLNDAIALARKNNPGLAQRQAEADAAKARLDEAQAGRLPSVTAVASAATGSANLGGFFGFERSTIHPEEAMIELRQPLFAGGAIFAAIDRARAAREAAVHQVAEARAILATETASAFVGLIDARETTRLVAEEQREVETLVEQASQKFKDGEIPRTDLAEAQARLAEIEAVRAEAEGAVVRAEARFQALVGAPPDALVDPVPAPLAAASLGAAVDAAERASPSLLSARANLRAAEDGVRGAEAGRLPTVSLDASALTMKDQFFPGYRNQGYTVGVEGRWSLFSGGLVTGQINEARAQRSAAEAGLDAAQSQVREAVVGAWEDVAVSRNLVDAAGRQAEAADEAYASAREEFRVGQRPVEDLLTAERQSLSAQVALLAAKGDAVVATYRLQGLLGAP